MSLSEVLPSTPGPEEDVRRGWRGTDSYLFALASLVILVAVSLDPTNFLSRGSVNGGSSSRYLIVIVPIVLASGVILTQRSVFRLRITWADLTLLLLTAWGLTGAVYGRVFDQQSTGALPIFVPMTIAIVHLVTASPMSRNEARSVLRKVSLICLLFVVLDAVVNTGFSQTLLADDSFRQYKAYLLAIAIAGALTQRKWRQAGIAILLSVYVYYQYKALTYPVTLVVSLVTWLTMRPKGWRLRLTFVAPIVVGFTAWVLLNFNTAVAFANTYFSSVDKVNNTGTRLALWRAGLGVFQQSPLFGSSFAGNMNVSALVAGTTVVIPVHCDFIEMMMGGGVLGLSLFAAWIVLTNVVIVKRHRGFVDKHLDDHARLLRVLLMGFNAFWAISLFNPVLENVGTAASFFVIYAIMMSVKDPAMYEVRLEPGALVPVK